MHDSRSHKPPSTASPNDLSAQRQAPHKSDSPVLAALHAKPVFFEILQLQSQAVNELAMARAMEPSTEKNLCFEAAHSAHEVAALAVKLLSPSQTSASYYAYTSLVSAQQKIWELREELPYSSSSTSSINPKASAARSRCRVIEDLVLFNLNSYVANVAPHLLANFFSLENVMGEDRQPINRANSERDRELSKIETSQAVLDHPRLWELPPIPALGRLVAQGVVAFEMLGYLSDRLRFDTDPNLRENLRDVLEEFMDHICLGRSCFETLQADILKGLPPANQSLFKEIIEPLELLLDQGHRDFVNAWLIAQNKAGV